MFARIGVSIVLLIAFLYCLPYLLGATTSDIPPINDNDLVPAVHSVPIEQNGWRFIEELDVEVKRTGLRDEPLMELVRDPDMEQVRTLIESNARAFDLFEAIADAPHFQDPGNSDPATFSADTTLSPLVAVRDMAHISLLRAHMANTANDATSTARAIEVPLRVAKHIASPNTTTVGFLVAIAIDTAVYDMIEKWLDAGSLNEQTSGALAEVLQHSETAYLAHGLKNAFQGEYVFSRNMFTQMNNDAQLLREVIFQCGDPSERACDTAGLW